jgi:DNA invertase Pin-like site-specific DNA recombinase
LGVSAWKGKNVKQGALGAFLKAVETGRVAPGSVLVVESLDRISRQRPLDALALWLQILQAGVEIHTIKPERQYSAESDQWSVFEALIILGRANEESEIKSHRIARAWKQKRAEANQKKLTRNCPAWLELSEDRTIFRVIKQAAITVQYIFHLCIEGVGTNAIARRLNRESVPLIARKSNSRTWYDSYVKKILHSRATIGEYQGWLTPREGKPTPIGDPVPGYYPAVIDEATFYKAQKALSERFHTRGRLGKAVTNLFQGIVADQTGETLYIVHRCNGDTSLVSSAALRGEKGYQYRSFPYPVFEKYLLRFLHELPVHELFATAPDITKTQKVIAETEGKLAENKRQLKRLQAKLLTDPDIDMLVDTARQIEDEGRQLQLRLEGLKQELHATTKQGILDDVWAMLEKLEVAEGDELYTFRLRLREAIRTLIEKVVVKVASSNRYTRLAECEVQFRQGGMRTIKIGCNTRNKKEWSIGAVPNDSLPPEVMEYYEWTEGKTKPKEGEKLIKYDVNPNFLKTKERGQRKKKKI